MLEEDLIPDLDAIICRVWRLLRRQNIKLKKNEEDEVKDDNGDVNDDKKKF